MSTLSPNPKDRMGVFKSLDGVPDRYRLGNYSNTFEGCDVWQEYLDEYLFLVYPDATDYFYETAVRAGRRWKEQMDERGRHHALARPEDVGVYFEGLLDELAINTVYNQYWIRLEDFYSWLQTHTDYPHIYHPVLMAVIQNDAAREIWCRKLSLPEWGGWE